MESHLLQRNRGKPSQEGPSTRARSYSLDAGKPLSKVEINYGQLRKLCDNFTPNERIDHRDFMKEYPSIFTSSRGRSRSSNSSRRRPTTVATQPPSRPQTCQGHSGEFYPGLMPGRHDIRVFLKGIHGGQVREKDKERVSLSAHLHAAMAIVRKLPILRSRVEVKELSQHLKTLMHSIQYDHSITEDDFFTGLSQRAILESIPSAGCSLPARGGLYLVLKGCVEKLDGDNETKKESVTQLHPGDCFGEVGSTSAEVTHVVKEVYPLYTATDACMLLRVNGSDYHRIIQTCKKNQTEEKQRTIRSCSLLYAVSPSILNRLAEVLTFEEIEKGTIVVNQGEPIDKVYFIQEGKCTATVQVPGTAKHFEIVVGELHDGDCIGEALIRKDIETHPYTITTLTHTKFGCVTHDAIKATELQKHILSDRTLTLPLLTTEQVRNSYVKKSMDRQWRRIKEYVMKEVTTERGIQFGAKKWQHSVSKP